MIRGCGRDAHLESGWCPGKWSLFVVRSSKRQGCACVTRISRPLNASGELLISVMPLISASVYSRGASGFSKALPRSRALSADSPGSGRTPRESSIDACGCCRRARNFSSVVALMVRDERATCTAPGFR